VNDPLTNGEYDWVDPKNPNKRLSASEQLRKLGIDPKAFSESMKSGAV